MALIQKAFSDIITFSRSSNATRVGPTGLVEYAPHNLLQRSQEFDNAYWTKYQSTVTANSLAAPDGTVTADTLTAASTGPCFTYSTAASLAVTTYTLSAYCKAGTANFAVLEISDTIANAGQKYFNLQNGTVGSTSTVGTNVVFQNATIQSVGNGWYRCTATFSITSATNYICSIYITDADNSTNVTNGRNIYLWGAQLAVGPYALDYTPTTTAAVYGPRFDYDPVTLAAKGLLVEEQRTNLLTYSEDLSNGAWGKTRGSVTANATASPDGTVNADAFIEDTQTGEHYLDRTASVFSGAAYTFSIFAKSNGRNWFAIAFTGATASGSSFFDLANGVLGTVVANASATITNVGNGWYRCTITVTTNSTTLAIYPVIAFSNGTISYTGNGTSGLYLWGAQLEAGSFATSYIPTPTNSTVTRSADVASVNTLSPWFNATEGTIYTESVSQANNRIAWFRNSATGTYIDFISSRLNNLFQGNSDVYVSGSLQSTVTTANAVNSSTLARIAAAYKANDFAISLNGGTVVTNTSGTIPAVNRLQIGWHDDGLYLNGHILRLAYYPRKLSSAELQALSA